MKEHYEHVNDQSMREDFQNSIWRQSKINGDWIMRFDPVSYDINLNQKSIKDLLDVNHSTKVIENDGDFKPGILVMTPTGLKKLLKIHENTAIVLDQFKNNINSGLDITESIPLENISKSFNVFIMVLNEAKAWYKLTLSTRGNVEDIKKQLDELKICNSENSDYQLIYQGKELREGLYFDQFNLKANSKILLKTIENRPHVLKRFTGVNPESYYYNDAITFTVNKRIRITGVGIYGTNSGRTVHLKFKFMEGQVNTVSRSYYDDNLDIPPAPNSTDCIYKHQFSSGIALTPGVEYTIAITLRPEDTDGDDVYSGQGGREIIDGDRGVIFTFKKTTLSGNSNVDRGAFPEIYYSY